MGIGIAVSVRNGSVAAADLVYLLLRVILEFTVKNVQPNVGFWMGSSFSVAQAFTQCVMVVTPLPWLVFLLPSSSRYENFYVPVSVLVTGVFSRSVILTLAF